MPVTDRPQYRHVCCCVDDAGGAGATIAEAHRLAGDSTRVSVVHVAPPEPVVRSALSEWGEVSQDDPLWAARAWLRQTTEAAGGGEAVLLTGDPPGEAACAWARDNGVDLMISSSRGGGLRHHVLGSFAARLAAAAPCPVLLLAAVSDRASLRPAAPAGPYAHVAALVDDSAASLRALDGIMGLAAADARLSAVTLRGPWRRMAQLAGMADARGADVRERVRELTGSYPLRLRGRQGPALAAWARDAGVDLAGVAADAEIGPGLRRDIGRLAAEGTCTVLVVRTGPPGEEEPVGR